MNKVQKLVADIVRESSFNDFDGDKVVDALEKNQDLWRGFVWGRFHYSPLITLRDIDKGIYSADTMYITPVKGKEQELEALCRGFLADEVDWYGGEEACSELGSSSPAGRANKQAYLRLWWD